MLTKKKLENIIWHIETNRKTQNDDTRMLDDVYRSLKLIVKEEKR